MLCPRCLGIELSVLWGTYPLGCRVMMTEGSGQGTRGTVVAFSTREGYHHPAVFWDDHSVNDGPTPIAESGKLCQSHGGKGITRLARPSGSVKKEI